MTLTQSRLKQIIKEELDAIMNEVEEVDPEVVGEAHQYGSYRRLVKINWYARIFGRCLPRR